MTQKLENLKELFNELDWRIFYPSVAVDLLSLVTSNRNAIRIPFSKNDKINYLSLFKAWSIKNNLYYSHDEYYFVISKVNNALTILLEDSSENVHTQKFGGYMGYPHCCTEWMEDIGEQNIDFIESKLQNERKYADIWKLIDIQYYLEGKSLISHIPCSSMCVSSLRQSLLTLSNLHTYHLHSGFYNWNLPNQNWLLKILDDYCKNIDTYIKEINT